jgi:hypothetical protein
MALSELEEGLKKLIRKMANDSGERERDFLLDDESEL